VLAFESHSAALATMNKIIQTLLIALAVLSGITTAFTVKTPVHTSLVSTSTSIRVPSSDSFYNHAQSLTSLHMVRVKIDPNAPKDDERINPAVFKNAIYLGSIVVAVLLPFAFLILKH
jgi:hypothetical protein